jgi:ribosomal protein L28
MPNLQTAHVSMKGRMVKARVCTRCLRTKAKAPR